MRLSIYHFFGLILYSLSQLAYSQFAEIPFRDGIRVPSNDLIYNGRRITQEYAKQLKTDLSELEPQKNELWRGSLSQKLDKKYDDLPIDSGEQVDYLDPIDSNSGVFRFNVLTNKNDVVTLYLDRTLHTALLRKNILRKLGYHVYGLKYLKKIKIRFKSEDQIEAFKTQLRISLATDSTKWIVENESFGKTLVIRDLSALELGQGNLYHLAMGVPTEDLLSRPLRAIVLAYALCDLPESVNRYNWHVGRIDQKKLIIPHFFPFNSFGTTSIDDIKWLGKRIAKLDVKKDLWEAVQESHFPEGVSDLVYQKLVSRRYDLLKKLSIKPAEIKPQPINYELSFLPNIKKGKVLRIDWTKKGFASRFASGDAEGPFKDFHYYILSLLQSNVFSNAVNKLNSYLRAFDPKEARLNLAEKQFKKGLDHYVKTGEFLQFPVSAWVSPIVNGGLIVSRDIVIGNYLGTDNLVQLADTFGYSVSTGLWTGLENIDNVNGALIKAGLSYVTTYTHLKPIVDLKNAFKEDYANILVTFYTRTLRRQLKKITDKESELDKENPDYTKLRTEYLGEIIKLLSNKLGVGESLLITDRLTPSLGVSGKIPLVGPGMTVDLSLGVNRIGVKRLQIYRKDQENIIIYDDRGNGIGFDWNISLSKKIPIIRFQKRSQKGSYETKAYTLNIDGDIRTNPNFFNTAASISGILKHKSTDVISELYSPVTIKGNYSDNSDKVGVLIGKVKSLRSYTDYEVRNFETLEGNYVSYRSITKYGLDWEVFLKDIIQMELQEISEDLSWSNNVWRDPEDTLGGVSKTFEAHLEARTVDGEIKEKFISFVTRYEGWKKNTKKVVRFAESINEKYGREIFDLKQVELSGTRGIYDILERVNIYDRGVKRLIDIDQKSLLEKLYAIHKDKGVTCEESRKYLYPIGDGKRVSICPIIADVLNKKNKCHRLDDKNRKKKRISKCWLQYVRYIYNTIPFNNFASIVGGQNLYLFAEINGFRKKSEELRPPIKGNGFGRVDPRYEFGILTQLQMKYGIQRGEFEAYWLRERL